MALNKLGYSWIIKLLSPPKVGRAFFFTQVRVTLLLNNLLK